MAQIWMTSQWIICMSGPHILLHYESSCLTYLWPILFFCQDNQAVGESLLFWCYYLLNKEYPPEGNAHLLYGCTQVSIKWQQWSASDTSFAQRLKSQLYNFTRTLVSVHLQEYKQVIRNKWGLSSFKAYYINNDQEPSFWSTVEAKKQCIMESGVGYTGPEAMEGLLKNQKVQEVWQELHIERRGANELLQPEEVRLMYHQMSEADAPQNKVSLNDGEPKTINKLSSFIPISEDAEECNDRAIKRLKRQLREAASSAALASWKITIHASGLSPGIVETEKILWVILQYKFITVIMMRV